MARFRSTIFILVALLLGAVPALAADPVSIDNRLGAAIPAVVSTGLESNHVLKSSPGSLYDFQVNFGTCASYPCWILIFDQTSLPSNGALSGATAPVKFYQISQNATLAASWAPGPPLKLLTGITIGCSTTGPFTLTATAQCTISGEVSQ
jgi:hypothetical protein